MANHGWITIKKNLKDEKVLSHLQEINRRRFGGKLDIHSAYKGDWEISYKGDTRAGFWHDPFHIWISSPKKLEHRHPHGWWMTYVAVVITEELAHKMKGIMSDEGVPEKWKPKPKKYPTYKDWTIKLHSWNPSFKEKFPDSYEQVINMELSACPPGMENY